MDRWIPQYEKELYLDIWNHPYYYRWWSEIKVKAAIKPRFQNAGYSNIRVRITYGEWPVTISYLKKRWNCDDGAVNNFLRTLVDEGLIALRKEGQATIIQVCNFERYCFNMQPEDDNSESLDALSDDTPCLSSSQQPSRTPYPTACSPPYDAPRSSPRQTPRATPTIIEEYNNKKKEKFNDVDVEAREQEFFEKLKTEQISLEQAAMSMHIGMDVLLSLLEDYYHDQLSKREVPHESLSHFKNGFFKWAREKIIEQQHFKNKANGKSKSNTARRDTASVRRGYEGSGITDADYDAPLPDEPGG